MRPETIRTPPRDKPSTSLKRASTAAFAFPRSAGADTRTRNVSPNHPATPLRDAPATTLMRSLTLLNVLPQLARTESSPSRPQVLPGSAKNAITERRSSVLIGGYVANSHFTSLTIWMVLSSTSFATWTNAESSPLQAPINRQRSASSGFHDALGAQPTLRCRSSCVLVAAIGLPKDAERGH